MPAFSFDNEPASLVYLITLTAGLMDGDGHLLEVTARQGTRAVLTGQSATRIHPALASFSTQQWSVTVEEGACLVVLPGPAIPYAGARYFQRGRVDLAAGGRLAWGDIWLAGRIDRGELSERYRWERIVQDFEVRRGGRLAYRDRFCWDGPMSGPDVDWHFGGQLASGSLFVSGPLPPGLPEPHASVRRSVFPLASGDTCVRWCGPPMYVTADLVRVALSAAGSWTGGPDAPPWLLATNELSPTHWFSLPA
jgi:urease accessory protein